MTDRVHRSSFIRELRERLPGIESWLVGYRDSLSSELMQFCAFTEDAIRRGDLACVKACFDLANWAFARGTPTLRNDIAVCYLEHLACSGPHGEAALRLLPPLLAAERDRVLVCLSEVSRRLDRHGQA